MRHDDRVRDEFSRQAATFSASPAITDAALTQRFIDALGEAAQGSVLDVVCGPGILSAAIAKTAREMVAFDLTPWRIISIGRAGRCPRYSAFSGPAAGLSSLMSFHAPTQSLDRDAIESHQTVCPSPEPVVGGTPNVDAG